MAYVDPLDPLTPAGGDVAGEGDDRIREMKRALIERLESFFEDIEADPLVPKAGIAGISQIAVGIAADRPVNPTTALLMYYAVDTNALSISDGAVAPAWETYDLDGISGGGGTPATNITYANLRKKTITAEDTIASLGTGWQRHLLNRLVAGAAPSDYVLLSVKGRVKRSVDAAYLDEWSQFGDSATPSPTAGYAADSPTGALTLWISHVKSQASGADLRFDVACEITNSSGAAVNTDVQVIIYLLAISATAPADA